ncbi:MAG: glycoside hydrolase family protein [Gemmatimonas sp.]|nr:glycoside hydrolase family protein [Gemmatimonas sp.]
MPEPHLRDVWRRLARFHRRFRARPDPRLQRSGPSGVIAVRSLSGVAREVGKRLAISHRSACRRRPAVLGQPHRALSRTVLIAALAAVACQPETVIPDPPSTGVSAGSPKRISERGMERIRSHEDFVAEPYDDGAGNETIGYGHRIMEDEAYAGGMTEAEAQELFAADVERVVNPSLDKVERDLDPHQIDALGSFIFNVGPRAFERFVLPSINAGDHDGATDEMLEYVRGKDQDTGEKVTLRGLVRRRKEEVDLYYGRRAQLRSEVARGLASAWKSFFAANGRINYEHRVASTPDRDALWRHRRRMLGRAGRIRPELCC